jgi:hypothetical protein
MTRAQSSTATACHKGKRISRDPDQQSEDRDHRKLKLVQREALGALGESWDSVGIYLLVGKPITDQAVHSVYVGRHLKSANLPQDS